MITINGKLYVKIPDIQSAFTIGKLYSVNKPTFSNPRPIYFVTLVDDTEHESGFYECKLLPDPAINTTLPISGIYAGLGICRPFFIGMLFMFGEQCIMLPADHNWIITE